MRQGLVVAVAIALWGGCERASSSTVRAVKPSAVQTTAAVTNRPPANLTPEMQEAVRMRDALDAGDTHKALALARGLVDSKDQKVLLQVVDVLEWVGKAAFPELTELADGKDEIVAEAALQAWDRVIDGVDDPSLRLAVIMRSARSLSRENLIDAVFLKLVDCDRIAALSALAEFIETSDGTVANRCAKEIYAHLASEDWESARRAKDVIEELQGSKS